MAYVLRWCFLSFCVLIVFQAADGTGSCTPPLASPGRLPDSDVALQRALLAALKLPNRTKVPRAAEEELTEQHVLRLSQHPSDRLSASLLSTNDKRRVRMDHNAILAWLSRYQAPLEHLCDAVKRRMAYNLGLLLHHQQHPSMLNAGLTSRPVHRCHGHHGCPGRLRFTAWAALDKAVDFLESALPAMTAEFDAAHATQRATEHTEGLHIQGKWELIKLFTYAGECDRVRMPTSCAALEKFSKISVRDSDLKRALGPHPMLLEARFATLHPGTVVVRHTSNTNQRLKVHCGIHNPGEVSITIANQSLAWLENRCIVIDDSYEHELSSTLDQPARTILELKITHPDLDHEMFVHEHSGEVLVHANGNRTAASTDFDVKDLIDLEYPKNGATGDAAASLFEALSTMAKINGDREY